MIKFESEKCLEEFIANCFSDDSICIINDESYQNLSQQFDTGCYGIPDLVFYSEDSEFIDAETEVIHKRIHVVELKNEQIKMSHISQICRYKRYFERAFDIDDVEMQFSLVVPEGVKNNDDVIWVIDQLNDISVYEFHLNPKEGIKFVESSGWYRKGENFSKALSLFESNEDEF